MQFIDGPDQNFIGKLIADIEQRGSLSDVATKEPMVDRGGQSNEDSGNV
jgi:hypothetical protein